MPLSTYVVPRIVIPLGGDNSMAVRGINLDDFTFLLPNHFEAMSKVVALYQTHTESVFSSRAFTDFILAVAKDFPGLLSEVISLSTDEDMAEVRKVKLPMSIQLAALSAILKLTVEEAGGLGNLIGQLRAAAGKAMAEAALAESAAPASSSSTGNGANR